MALSHQCLINKNLDHVSLEPHALLSALRRLSCLINRVKNQHSTYFKNSYYWED
jgi:hypothetical protein